LNAALIPVRHLSAGKSRLEKVLSRDEIRALTLAMLGDVIEALAETPEIDRVAVVTPDPDIAESARTAGAEALLDPKPGLNASLDRAGAALRADGATSLLVVLGDVAGVRALEVSALYRALREHGSRGAVMAPARDGGTAALLRAPADVLPNRFGVDSAAAHREAAREQGVPWSELDLASLRIDLDRPEDLEDALAFRNGARRTRAVLGRRPRAHR